MKTPIALTIAGSDSGGGAGIQADLKTFERFEVFGTSILTLITAQNTQGVTEIYPLPVDIVKAQAEAVFSDFAVSAMKTGALGSTEMITTVAAILRQNPDIPLVVDPVMISKHGYPLLADEAINAVKAELLPLATVLTPNLFEAERILGREIAGVEERERAALDLQAMGPKAVFLKAGGLRTDEPLDILAIGGECIRLIGSLQWPRAAHGTGCTLSAAVVGRLAHGDSIAEAAATAKAYITKAIAAAPNVGKGIRPVMHRV